MIIKNSNSIQSGSKLFLAEGNAEAHFIDQVLSVLNQHDAQVYKIEGLNRLGTVLKGVDSSPGIENLSCLGLMLDAESCYSARVDSIVSHFCNRNLPVTARQIHTGSIFMIGACRVGAFISPGNRRNGQIEDLVLEEIKKNKVWSCIQKYSECLSNKTTSHLDKKGLVQVYISTIAGGTCGVGHAFRQKILDVGCEVYEPARRIIQDLVL